MGCCRFLQNTKNVIFTSLHNPHLSTGMPQVPAQACKLTAPQLHKTTCTAHLTTYATSIQLAGHTPFAHSLCSLLAAPHVIPMWQRHKRKTQRREVVESKLLSRCLTRTTVIQFYSYEAMPASNHLQPAWLVAVRPFHPQKVLQNERYDQHHKLD